MTAASRLATGAGKAPPRRSWVWRYRRLLFLGWLLGFTGVSGLAYVLTLTPLPEPAPQHETTLLTDVTGAHLASFDAGENRVPVALSEVPSVVVDAVLAAEDRNFFSHSGIDPTGVARAAWADVRGQRLQGGSTITQQYVKNVLLKTRERTLWRKVQEAALALKVERRYDKPQILERYLNTVYFGRGAYGVQAASRSYFGKDVQQLALPEAAYLAGLIRAPEDADASRDAAAAKQRRDRTLAAMQRSGAISEADRAAVEALPVAVADGGYVLDRTRQLATVVRADKGTEYFVEHVRQQLVTRYGETATYGGGLRVRTTLDLGMQAAAFDAVVSVLDRTNDPSAALVAIDDEGQVRAMVGGRGHQSGGPYARVNLAVGASGGGTGRQAGSTFKPFLLAALVRDGWSVQSTFPAPREVVLPKADDGRDYPVNNYEDAEFGEPMTLVDATAHSVNTVFVQAQVSLGAEKVAQAARDLGIVSPVEPNASLVLGTEEVSVYELAAAYSTLANGGLRIQPRTILEVRTAAGRVLERSRPEVRRVLEREHAAVVGHCLQQVITRGSGSGAQLAVPVAGKTGTTQNFGDAWFVGYTPKLTAAVWMGYPEGPARRMTNVHGRRVNGGSFPATIFKRFMDKATAGAEPVPFPAARLRGRTLPPPSPDKVMIPTTSTSTSPPAPPSPETTVAPPPPES